MKYKIIIIVLAIIVSSLSSANEIKSLKIGQATPSFSLKNLETGEKESLENYKENRMKDTLLKEINIVEDGEKQIKELIKEGTITDNLLIESIKNVMKERINND